MRAMLWKELRENFKWAVLAMVGLCMAEIYSLSDISNNNDGITLVRSSFLMVTIFGSAAVGLALAFLQIFPELRRDQWAALLHRPVRRETILLGKIVAGLVLYILAVGVPFLISVIYVATPGDFAAPFVPGMIKPGLSDLAFGVTCYFGGLLIALERGRWWLGKIGVGMALIYIGQVRLTCADFLSSLFWSAVFCAPLVLAAMGFMRGNGHLRRQPWLCRISWLIIFYLGLAPVGTWIAGWVAWDVPTPDNSSDQGGFFYRLHRDGSVDKIVPLANNRFVILDLQGHVVKTGSYDNNENPVELPGFYVVNVNGSTSLPIMWGPGGSYRAESIYVQSVTKGNGESWFSLPQQHYYIGYNVSTRRAVAILDAEGYKSPSAKIEPLIIPATQGGFGRWNPGSDRVQIGNTIYARDLPHRIMKPIYQSNGEEILDVRDFNMGFNTGRHGMLVVVPGKIHLLDLDGKELMTIPYDLEKAKQQPQLSFSPDEKLERFYLEYEAFYNQRVFYETRDATGKLLKSYDLPGRPVPFGIEEEPSFRLAPYVTDSLESLAFYTYGFAMEINDVRNISNREARIQYWNETFPWQQRREVAEGIYAVSTILALVAFACARRLGLSERRAVGWTIFVFLFNLAGLLALLLAADWPVRVKCPQCGRKRAVEETTCPHCQALWPMPKANGLEIFEKRELVTEKVS